MFILYQKTTLIKRWTFVARGHGFPPLRQLADADQSASSLSRSALSFPRKLSDAPLFAAFAKAAQDSLLPPAGGLFESSLLRKQ